MNIAQNAEKMAAGSHPGYEPSALEGLTLSLEVLNEKRIKVIINGGALNPKGLAEQVQTMIDEKDLDLQVAWVAGDNLMDKAQELLRNGMKHLDAENANIKLVKNTDNFLDDPKKPIVGCNAYLGARAITKGLQEGADIIICGRVSDASPVIGAAQWWHNWSDRSYDELAGALIAGHLIECSTYSTGANYAGFYDYPIENLLNLGLPIAEIAASGECVITKADKFNGIVTSDTITCQLLYELQGDVYLNGCVKADISNIAIQEESKNRVRVTGVRGYPPPPTTKLAVFYRGGWQCEGTFNATGYASTKKYDLFEAQVVSKLKEWDLLEKFDVLELQRVGTRELNATNQLASTSYLRMFAQAPEKEILYGLLKAFMFNGMQHFAGACSSGDSRTMIPMSYLAYYPAAIEQNTLEESVNFLGKNSRSFTTGHPPVYEPLAARNNYETRHAMNLEDFGPTIDRPLGDVALARSGDKGANVNIGIFVRTDEQWEWLRSFLTCSRMQTLCGGDWQVDFWIERVEFPNIRAVHFVIYGILGRGVSSSSRLDSLGKAFGEYIRDRLVPIPQKFWDACLSVPRKEEGVSVRA